MRIAHSGFSPSFIQTMVTVLNPERAVVDRLYHLLGRSIVPVAEFRGGGWDIVCSVRAEIIDHHIGVLV